jgi:hypothetical protein
MRIPRRFLLPLFALWAVAMIVIGVRGIVNGVSERSAERQVSGLITAVGANCDYELTTNYASAQSVHVDLCPAVPSPTAVTITYDRYAVTRLELDGATIDVTTDQASLDYTAGGVRAALGLGMLLLCLPFVMGWQLPRPTPRAIAFVVASVSIGTAMGAVAEMDPLHESTLAELIGGMTGFCIGLLVAAGGLAAHRCLSSRRNRLNIS